MQRFLLATIAMAAFIVSSRSPAPPPQSDARAQQLIKELKLEVLPKESGYLGIIGVSAQTVTVDGRALAVQSQNYYMLTRDRPINYLHWLAPDDTHILIEGGPVDYFIFHPDGHVEKVTLGMDLAAGQRPVVAVPGGCWKALRLADSARYALMANTLSPEFTPDRVKIGAGPAWIKTLPRLGALGDTGNVARIHRPQLDAVGHHDPRRGRCPNLPSRAKLGKMSVAPICLMVSSKTLPSCARPGRARAPVPKPKPGLSHPPVD